MKRLIIDGNNLVHRAYWVASNQPIFNEHFHVHLFLTSVKNYAIQYQPDVIHCTWDEKVDYTVNKRKELLEEYKGTRDKERNKEVHSKNNIIKELLEYLGIQSIYPRAYEADDVMCILNHMFPNDDKVIVTVDKDLCQLISDRTTVYDPIRKTEFTVSNFEEKIGYKLNDFVSVKALTGDKSDNIPGLKGFGKVKLSKFFNGEYHLNEHEQVKYENNLKLVDLSLTLNDKEEVDYVKNQLAAEAAKNFDLFKQRCIDLNFKQVIKNIDTWYNIFYMRSKLNDLLFSQD